MKNLILIILIQTISFSCFSQVDFPFIKEGAVWSESRLGLGIPLSYYHYGMSGDTIIQDTTYKKVYIWQGATDDINLAEKNFLGLAREENQIVTFKHPLYPYVDTLFNAQWEIGDSLGVQGDDVGTLFSSRIKSIDSVLINGEYRKRWIFYGQSSTLPLDTFPIFSYIDGIGTDRFTFLSAQKPYFDMTFRLLCYQEEVTQIYVNPLTSTCGFITSNHEINDSKNIQVEIFPNPTSHSFFIKNKTPQTNENQIQLFDFKGKMVFEKTIHIFQNQSIEIETVQFPAGIYFLKIKNDKTSTTQKLIVQQ